MSSFSTFGAAAVGTTDLAIKKEGQETHLTKKELRAAKKEFRKSLKKEIKDLRKEKDTELVLLVILGIIIPPLAMGLYDGITNRFWISLLLTLLFWLPGAIYTLVVILGEN